MSFAGAQRELNAELASNPGSLMAKLGRARLHVEQGAVADGVKEISEVWKADANFLRVNVPLFNAGLSRTETCRLCSVLWKNSKQRIIFLRKSWTCFGTVPRLKD